MNHEHDPTVRRVVGAYVDVARLVGFHDFLPHFLALLFLKNESVAPRAREAHVSPAFKLPGEHPWAHLEHRHENLVQHLDAIMEATMAANSWIRPCLDEVRFSLLRMGPAANLDGVLHKLIRDLSSVPYLDEPIAAAVCSAAIARAAAAERYLVGTPPAVCDLMVRLLAPEMGSSVHDPVCGVGETLAACQRYHRHTAGAGETARPTSLLLSGSERNRNLWSICRFRLLLGGTRDAEISMSDVLRDAGPTVQCEPTHYHHVISCPPMNVRFDADLFRSARGPGRVGELPRTSFADLAYVYHALSLLLPGGTASMLVSRGPLFRGAAEQDARRALVCARTVKAVIELPPNLMNATSLSVFVLLLRESIGKDGRDGVVFVDASREHGVHGKKNVLRPMDIERILQACSGSKDGHEHSRFVSTEEIESCAWSLNPRNYLRQAQASPDSATMETLQSEIAAIEASRDEAAQAMDRAVAVLMQLLGHPSAPR